MLAVVAGCSGDHGALAADDAGPGAANAVSATAAVTAASSGAGGGSSSAQTGSAGGGSSASISTAGATGSGGAGAGGGPPGPTKLTLVNGVTDYPAVRLCLLSHPGGENENTPPWPDSPEGLAFAHAKNVDLASVVPEGTDVRIHVLAGDLAAIAGKSCGEALALAAPGDDPDAGPPIVAVPLAVLPAAAFASGKRLLVVVNGCLGGPGHTDPSEQIACGMGYSPTKPTAGLVALGTTPSKDPAHLAIQIVHAAVPMPPVDVRITPGIEGAPDWQVAPKLSLGAIGPQPAFTKLTAAQLGDFEKVVVKTFQPGSNVTTSATLFADVLASSELGPGDLVDGESIVLVAVGAYPGVPAGPWWHALTYALVRADP